MDASTYVLLVDVPLVLVLAVIGAMAWNRSAGSLAVLGRDSPIDTKIIGVAAIFGLWLLVTLASMWLAFLGGLVLVYALLFLLGHAAAAIGGSLVLAFLVSIPFLWGWALIRWGF